MSTEVLIMIMYLVDLLILIMDYIKLMQILV